MRATLISLVLWGALSGCEREVTSTFVEGQVGELTMPSANAVVLTETGLLGGERRTVWLGSGLQCSQLKPAGGFQINFGPTERGLPDGGRLPTLILSGSGGAQLDTGDGGERLSGSLTSYQEQSFNAGVLKGRFEAKFTGGTFTGDFVAGTCETASAGCSAAPGAVFGALALVWLARRVSPSRSRRSTSAR